MSKSVGSADTAGRLIEILQQFSPETKVRVKSLNHSWPVNVKDYGLIDGVRYLQLEF